jgi:hypothetical protein
MSASSLATNMRESNEILRLLVLLLAVAAFSCPSTFNRVTHTCKSVRPASTLYMYNNYIYRLQGLVN